MTTPNILIIYTDQQRWDALGANGNDEIHTPNLDALAAAGVNFDRHFVQNPVSMPSRVSFLTGQYPSTLCITHMGVPVPRDTLTLPRMLHNGGYTSANIGKLHFLPHANRDHREVHPDYGFDHLEISDEPGPYEDAYRAWVRAKSPESLDLISAGLPPAAETWNRIMRTVDPVVHPEERFPKRPLAFRADSGLTHTAFVADQTISFIERDRSEPFLCVAGIYSPHSPWLAPQEFFDLYDPEKLSIPTFPPEMDAKRSEGNYCNDELRRAKHGYYGMVSEVDHHVGRILESLDRRGIADDTIVVFTSDHGEYLGEQMKYGKWYPGPDCVSRVPLLVRWPNGIREPGRTISDIVEAVDVVPTLLECAGAQIPPQVQGRSLRPWLDGGDVTGKGAALLEVPGAKTLRTRRYRYASQADGTEKLWDIENDPGEYHDVSADAAHSEALVEHRRLLLQRTLEIERPLPKAWSY